MTAVYSLFLNKFVQAVLGCDNLQVIFTSAEEYIWNGVKMVLSMYCMKHRLIIVTHYTCR